MFEFWGAFGLAATVIAVAGARLSRYGHIIAEKTGMGDSLVGLVMLATVTSLPELVTGVAAVTWVDAPDIALGDALGSCVFNLLILMVLEFFCPEASIYTRAGQSHILSAGFGVIIIGIAALGIVVSADESLPVFGHVGLATPALIATYVLAIQTITRHERQGGRLAANPAPRDGKPMTLRQAAAGYAMAAVFVLLAGSALPFIAERISDSAGWNQSFIGTLFVAFATSLPEIVVVYAAVRLGSIDMAIANLLGSNLFDALIIAIDDIAYTKGPILAAASNVHAATAISAMIMTGAVIVALFYRPAERPLRIVGWTGLFLLAVYAVNAYLVFVYGS